MKKGFTLIELLIVIAILALLISILLPGLSRAKAIAKRTTCATSLRTLGQALSFYTNESNDWLPSAEPRNREPISPLHWFMNAELLQYISVTLTTDENGDIFGFSKDNSPLICPSHKQASKSRPTSNEPSVSLNYSLSYGMNGTFGLGGRPDQTEYRRMMEFRTPSATCSLADSWGTFSGPGVVLYHSCVRENLAYRHSGTANVAFLDTHMEYLRSNDIPTGFVNRFDPFWSAWKPQ